MTFDMMSNALSISFITSRLIRSCLLPISLLCHPYHLLFILPYLHGNVRMFSWWNNVSATARLYLLCVKLDYFKHKSNSRLCPQSVWTDTYYFLPCCRTANSSKQSSCGSHVSIRASAMATETLMLQKRLPPCAKAAAQGTALHNILCTQGCCTKWGQKHRIFRVSRSLQSSFRIF